MKPDYKNWMPKGMVLGTLAGTLGSLLLFIVFGCTNLLHGKLKTVLFFVFLALTVVLALVTLWMALMYRAFSYNGKRQMSKQIIEGIADYVKLPDGGRGGKAQPERVAARHRSLGQRIRFVQQNAV